MEYENKDAFLKKCYSIKCPSPILARLTKEIVVHNYSHYGLDNQLNVILANALPPYTDSINGLRKKGLDIDRYMNESLKYAIAVLHFAFNDKADERPIIVTKLGDAFYTLTKDVEENAFKPPRPKETFDIVKHDYALEAFRRLLIDHLESINTMYYIGKDIRRTTATIIACFARTLFEIRCFQAPPRFTLEEAIRDSRGESDLWKEYIGIWQLKKYFA